MRLLWAPYLITTTWGSGEKPTVSPPGSGGQKFQNQGVGGGGWGAVGLPVKSLGEGPFLIPVEAAVLSAGGLAGQSP